MVAAILVNNMYHIKTALAEIPLQEGTLARITFKPLLPWLVKGKNWTFRAISWFESGCQATPVPIGGKHDGSFDSADVW